MLWISVIHFTQSVKTNSGVPVAFRTVWAWYLIHLIAWLSVGFGWGWWVQWIHPWCRIVGKWLQNHHWFAFWNYLSWEVWDILLHLKIFIQYRAMTLCFHRVDIYHTALDTIEDLRTCISISGNWLHKSLDIQMGKCDFQCLWRGTQSVPFS